MVDVHSKKQRSYNMARIKGKGTSPELFLRKQFLGKGFTYQPRAYGKPDFINFKRKIAVFIDGCFWHKCPKHYVAPETNKIFWRKKIDENVRRDKEIQQNYIHSGWKVIRIWEHQVFINSRILELL